MEGKTLSDPDKVKVAARFLSLTPPGEFNEVFNDVRVLLDNDTLLKEATAKAVGQYNKDQFVHARVDEQPPVIVSRHNEVAPGRFHDPRSQTTFAFDHLKRTVSNVSQDQLPSLDSNSERWRAAFQLALATYVREQFGGFSSDVCSAGVSVFAAPSADDPKVVTLIACVESHHFQPHNYWGGRWRSQWSVSFNPSSGGGVQATGFIKLQIHYYEDGNVQLVSNKTPSFALNISDPDTTASNFAKAVFREENGFQVTSYDTDDTKTAAFIQTGLRENFLKMNETTFKALRRQLPVTKAKIDWLKLASYRIGSELEKSVAQ